MKQEASLDWISRRQCIRSFKPDPVADSDIRFILEAAIRAPNAGNLQPWRFVVVRNPNIKQRLADAAYGQTAVSSAPVVIMVVALPEQSAFKYGSRGRSLYCIQDTAAATQNALLAATALGLGTCWIGAFDEGKAAAAVGLKQAERPVVMIPVGYADEKPDPTGRLSVDEVARFID